MTVRPAPARPKWTDDDSADIERFLEALDGLQSEPAETHYWDGFRRMLWEEEKRIFRVHGTHIAILRRPMEPDLIRRLEEDIAARPDYKAQTFEDRDYDLLARSEAEGLAAARTRVKDVIDGPRPTGRLAEWGGAHAMFRVALAELGRGPEVVPGPGARLDIVAFRAGWGMVLTLIERALGTPDEEHDPEIPDQRRPPED